MGARGAVQTPVQEETRTPSPVCMRDARGQGGLFANPESLLAQVPVTMCQSSRAGAQQWRWRAGNNSRGIALRRSRAAYTAWCCALRMCSLNPCAEHEQGFVSAAGAIYDGPSLLAADTRICRAPAARQAPIQSSESSRLLRSRSRNGFGWDSQGDGFGYHCLPYFNLNFNMNMDIVRY